MALSTKNSADYCANFVQKYVCYRVVLIQLCWLYLYQTCILFNFDQNIFFYDFFRQLLLCRVTLGKSFLQFNAMKMAHAPPGHHSVVGRPSVGGLAYPEYVVYRGEQVKIVI